VRNVRLRVVEGRKRRHFMPVIEEHVAAGSIVHTDSHASYKTLTS